MTRTGWTPGLAVSATAAVLVAQTQPAGQHTPAEHVVPQEREGSIVGLDVAAHDAGVDVATAVRRAGGVIALNEKAGSGAASSMR